MFEFLKKFASRSSTPGSTLSMPTHAEHATNSHLEVFGGVEAGDLAVTRYPPFDKGIPLIEIDTLIRSQADLKRASFAQPAFPEKNLMSVLIRRFAIWRNIFIFFRRPLLPISVAPVDCSA